MAGSRVPDPLDRLVAATGLEPSLVHGFVTALALAPEGWEPQEALTALLPDTALPDEALVETLFDNVDAAFDDISENRYAPCLQPGPPEQQIAHWQAGFALAMDLDLPAWETRHELDTQAGMAYLSLVALARPDIAQLLHEVDAAEHPAYVREQLPFLPGVLHFLQQRYLVDDAELDVVADMLEPEALELPEFEPAELAALDADAVFGLLLELGDAVPEPLFERAVALGNDLEPRLTAHLANPQAWHKGAGWKNEGLWWGLHHAIYILGRLTSQAASDALLYALEQHNRYPDDELWEWLGGCWPGLFANKGTAVMPALQAAMEADNNDPFLRVAAMEALTLLSRQQGARSLETQLDRIANITATTTPGTPLEELSAMHLLDFPRERHRALLEQKAADFEQRPDGTAFGRDEVELAFSQGVDTPEFDHLPDPWQFYDAQEIRQRQARWLQEALHEDLDDDLGPDHSEWPIEVPMPQRREHPKIGRNDPCPCGSGKKYKHCCLH
jgi:yecA family protein